MQCTPDRCNQLLDVREASPDASLMLFRRLVPQEVS